MLVILHRMRCSKVKLIIILLIFSTIMGLEPFRSHWNGRDGQSAELFSSERRSEENPNESWISGKINQLYYS